MPSTGVFFIPVPPNGASPSAALIAHISRGFPSQPLQPYFLDHRLMFDTPSILPGSNPATRRYAQFLTLSHLPGKTFLGTTATAENGVEGSRDGAMSIITIPSGPAAESFYEMTTMKMQPLFAPRQNVRVDNGTALELTKGDWRMRIGDVRIASRQGQGNVKGVIIEVQYCADEEGDEAESGEKENGVTTSSDLQEQMLQSFFDATTRGSGVSMDGLRVVVKVPGIKKTDPPGWVIVRQYMEILRGTR